MIKILECDRAKMTSTDESILNSINEDPGFFTSHTISELAKHYYVAESTITRMAKHIGFSNIKQLQMHVYERLNSWIKNYQITDCDNIKDIAANIRSIYSYSINESIGNFDYITLELMLNDILTKKRIILYGIGNSNIACSTLADNLNMLGYNAFAINDIHKLLVMLNTLGSDYLLVIFSVSATTLEIRQVLEMTLDFHINIALVTASHDTSIKQKYNLKHELVFKLHETENSRFPSLSAKMVELLITDIIFYSIIKLQPELQERIDRANELTEKWNSIKKK